MDIIATELDYRILGEVVSCFFSVIMGFNVILTFSSYEKKQRLFLIGIAGTFFSTLFDVLNIILMARIGTMPLAVNTIVASLFFGTLLLAPVSMSLYAVENTIDNDSNKRVIYMLVWGIYAAYILVLLANLKNGWIFKFTEELTYEKGPLKYLTYILTIIYIIIIESVVFSHKKNMAPRLFSVFLLYPIVSASLLAIQFRWPNIIMTGSACFATLLLAYIAIQSDMIEYDMVSGLMTEGKLKKTLENKNTVGFFYVLSIENMPILQNNMKNSDFEQLQLDIGREFLSNFEHSSYHISTNRFASIVGSLEELKKKADEIDSFLQLKHYDSNLKIPAKLEFYSAVVDFSNSSTNEILKTPTLYTIDKKRSYNDITEIVNNLLKKAKLDGDHSLIICDETSLLVMKRKNIIYEILKRELSPESEQFQVWYQPIYSIEKQKFTYMEALSRLRNTELGDISPAEFVEVAEERGLIEKLGFIAFTKVCQFITENNSLVNGVSINFSGYQMLNPNIVEIVLNTIYEYKIQPQKIIMEITESIFIENSELVSENMRKLSAAGVRFYLDDFGTGYSNLANVIYLNFSTIKMDRSLVLMLERNERTLKFFMNIVNTFKNAGFKILTEGVETPAQAAIVKGAGTDYIQGFLYSKPLPPADCINLLRKQEASGSAGAVPENKA